LSDIDYTQSYFIKYSINEGIVTGNAFSIFVTINIVLVTQSPLPQRKEVY